MSIAARAAAAIRRQIRGERGTVCIEITEMQLETAIKALEKQVPRKPLNVNPPDMEYLNVYGCPACYKDLPCDGVGHYCYHCGQRIDWDDQE